MKLSLLLITLSLLIFSCDQHTEQQSAKNVSEKYNILWIVCEDQSLFFPMYGDSVAHTPNLNKLASEGIVYDNFTATAPVCSPSRSSIITGMYQTTLGTHNMRAYNPYKNENQSELGIPSYSPILPEDVKCFTEYLREEGYYCTNNAKEDYNFATPFTAWDESSNKAHWRNRPDEETPFFAVFNYNVTHESQLWKNADKGILVDKSSIKLPPYFPKDSIIVNDFAVNYSNIERLDKQVGALLTQLEEDGLMEKTIIFFYSDHGGPFPRHKRAIYESGLKAPLIVRFPGQKDKGSRNDQLISFIDLAPTTLALAGAEIPNHIQGVSFLGPKATEREYVFAATDRFDGEYDRKRSIRDKQFKYIRNFYPEKPHAMDIEYRENVPMMRRLNILYQQGALNEVQKRWFESPKPEEELYDLESDPHELNNLAYDEHYKEVKEKLSKELDNWLSTTNDLGEIEEKALIKRFRPNGKQPVTSAPDASIEGDSITISCTAEGASIGWKFSDEKEWNLYTKPLSVSLLNSGQSMDIKAIRIGYKESEQVTYYNP